MAFGLVGAQSHLSQALNMCTLSTRIIVGTIVIVEILLLFK
jgi:hypothetical protein